MQNNSYLIVLDRKENEMLPRFFEHSSSPEKISMISARFFRDVTK
jgi:hypothetical protein